MQREEPLQAVETASTPAVAEFVAAEEPLAASGEDFPIVGIGASAGGLEACRRLLGALPADADLALVVVQHLHPDLPSLLPEILSRSTPLPVLQVNSETPVQAGRVYVIPPGSSMVIDRRTLHLRPRRTGPGSHRPIDGFFESLARQHTHRAIAVVLSGTGSDGTRGVECIKAEGGITMAQDGSAEFDGMPNSAVASGCTDFVLSPEEIAGELERIGRHPYVMSPMEAKLKASDPSVIAIVELVREVSGIDFSDYKSATLNRRLTRKQLTLGFETMAEYLEFLRQRPEEVLELYRDLLVSVTSFFRNPESFAALEHWVWPRLFRGRAVEEPVRIWVLGCATGEEAYSIAISLQEFIEREHLVVPCCIFATDMNVQGLEYAQEGLYAGSIANHVSPARLERYFDAVPGGFRIKPVITNLCVFARQNVLSDPPLEQMDLISCRNLFAFSLPALQQRLLPRLQLALKHDGFLWTGSAGIFNNPSGVFLARDNEHKLYQRLPGDPLDLRIRH